MNVLPKLPHVLSRVLRRIYMVMVHIVFVVLLLLLTLYSCARLIATALITEQTSITAPLDPTTIVTSSGKHFTLSHVRDALLDSQQASPKPHQHLITLIHGMGDYPDKAFREGAFSRISGWHNADVLLFNWPSWLDFRTLPVLNAQQSGNALADYLQAFNALTTKDLTARYKSRSLWVHSMGARVLASMVQNTKRTLPADLFDSIVIIAAEIDVQDHAEWLANITFAKRIFVLLNGNDPVLRPPETLFSRNRLGRGLVRIDGTQETLARNATYIHIDQGSPSHSYHVRRRSNNLQRLFQMILDNKPLSRATPILLKTPQANLFYLKADEPTPE